LLETVVTQSGAAPRVLSRLADAMFEEGRKAEAVRYYRLALDKDPRNEWACYRLAVLLEKNGGEEFLDKIKTDPTLVRMAQAIRKEIALNARR
jgi:TPR repeat protein